ncbi:DUF2239 family protein [Sorangium sp. So ce375]|jgi:uncharacterized protein|uniref:DUF2239 family protein n=1 Tax=Sorangium sp. So ce375 TaxID=3133306 RepID=UPI003F5C12CF
MSDPPTLPTFTAFAGAERIVRGTLEEMLREAKKRLDADPELRLLIFEDASGKQVDFDFRGTLDQVLSRAMPERPAKAGPGRPKLGVVSREVSLLPRHWEWLERQPQGISAALRRLVEEASKRAPDEDRAREARAAASRFMWVMAGDLPLFEEASRALFASDKRRFTELTRSWPADVREHLSELLREGGAFPAEREGKPRRTR